MSNLEEGIVPTAGNSLPPWSRGLKLLKMPRAPDTYGTQIKGNEGAPTPPGKRQEAVLGTGSCIKAMRNHLMLGRTQSLLAPKTHQRLTWL